MHQALVVKRGVSKQKSIGGVLAMVGVLQIKREDGTALPIKGSTQGYCALIVALGVRLKKLQEPLFQQSS